MLTLLKTFLEKCIEVIDTYLLTPLIKFEEAVYGFLGIEQDEDCTVTPHHKDFGQRTNSAFDNTINPATGLPMSGGVDLHGNAFGCGGNRDSHNRNFHNTGTFNYNYHSYGYGHYNHHSYDHHFYYHHNSDNNYSYEYHHDDHHHYY